MNKSKYFLTAVYLLLAGVSLVLSQAPERINYQGHLTDNNGAAFTGNANFTFVIFDAVTAGANLWSETQTNIPVADGLFNVELGSVAAFPGGLFSGASRYLQINANGNLLSPRQKITGVAYALHANNVAYNSVGSGEVIDGSVSAIDIADEPGVAYSIAIFTTTPLLGETKSFDSLTIDVPAEGYIQVTTGGYVYLNHVTGTGTQIWFNIENFSDLSSLDGGPAIINIPSQYPSTTTNFNSFYVSRLYSVSGPGLVSFYANMRWTQGAGAIFHGRTNMSATYIPSWYGAFNKTGNILESGATNPLPGN